MKYFTIEELCASDTAKAKNITNTPTEQHKDSLEKLVDNVLDKLREWYGKPIIVNSGYRGTELNEVVKGSNTSQHCKGEAADIVASNRNDNAKLFNYIKENLPFDQLIWEKGDNSNPSWIHVSYSSRNRKEVLKYNGTGYTRMV